MGAETMAGRTIELDEDGCLMRAADWDEQIAAEIAARAGIAPLTEAHWRVIQYMRQRYLNGEHPPTCRVVSQQTGLSPREIFRLFPHQPIHLSAKIAGVPEPHDYIGGCGVNWWSRWR